MPGSSDSFKSDLEKGTIGKVWVSHFIGMPDVLSMNVKEKTKTKGLVYKRVSHFYDPKIFFFQTDLAHLWSERENVTAFREF